MTIQTYTIILLYPDYCAENYGQDTYMTTAAVAVSPREIGEAVLVAKAKMMHDCTAISSIDDIFVIAVIAGEHQDLWDR